jgi:hypothetical protein
MVEALANILKDFYLMSNWYYSPFPIPNRVVNPPRRTMVLHHNAGE